MIKKIKTYIANIKDLLNSDIYKGIFLFIILIVLISFYITRKDLLFENSFLYCISSPLYQLFIMISLFISSLYTSRAFDTKLEIVLRYNNKKNYFKSMLLYTTLINAIIYFLSIGLCFILLLISYWNNISFIQFEYYNIPYFIYNIFTVIKYFVILNLLCLISVELKKLFNNVISTISIAVILIFKEGYLYSFDLVNDFNKIKIFFGYYLYPFQYASLFLEIFALFIQVILLSIIIYIIFFFLNKAKKINLSE